MRRKYILNIVNLIPWSWGPWGYWMSLWIMKVSGFDGIHVLPFRGWPLKWLTNSKYILSYADAWNYGTWWDVFLRHTGKKPSAPTVIDKVFFKQAIMPHVKRATKNTIYVWGRGALEISPNHINTVEQAVNMARSCGQKYAWDTLHLLEPNAGGDQLDWEMLLKKLSELGNYSIVMIHAHSQGIDDFIDRDSQIRHQLVVLAQATDADTSVILELDQPLIFTWPWVLIRRLRKFRTELGDIFD